MAGWQAPGPAGSPLGKTEVVGVPLEALVVGLQRGHANMLAIATVYKNKTVASAR